MPTFAQMIEHLFNLDTNSLQINTNWYGEEQPVWGLNLELSLSHDLVINDFERQLTKDDALIKFEQTHFNYIWDLYMESTDHIHQMTSFEYFNELCA